MRANEQLDFQIKYFSFGHGVKALFQNANKYFKYRYILRTISQKRYKG